MRAGVCPVAGCDRHLAPAKPFCYAHWFRVPPQLQVKIQQAQRELWYVTQNDLWLEDVYKDLLAQAVASLTPPEPKPLE